MKSKRLLFFFLVLSGLRVSAQHQEQIYVPDPGQYVRKTKAGACRIL
jgi:hypothetical protein